MVEEAKEEEEEAQVDLAEEKDLEVEEKEDLDRFRRGLLGEPLGELDCVRNWRVVGGM
jgi:hypothetical protein